MRVDTYSLWKEVKPRKVSTRRKVLEQYGKGCFLMPEGSPNDPGVPHFPVCSIDGKLACSGLEASYRRLIMLRKTTAYKHRAKALINKVIRLALPHSNLSNPYNQCNWAVKAAETQKPVASLKGENNIMAKRKMRRGECRKTKKGQKYCFLKDGVRFVGLGGSGLSGTRRKKTRRKTTRRKKTSRKMRVGECRKTDAGVTYCKMRNGRVRFRKKGSKRRR